jgi:hypothetical protein
MDAIEKVINFGSYNNSPTRQELFNTIYKNVNYDNLVNTDTVPDGQKRTVINDGCTHYVDKTTGKKYRWNFIKNKWMND